MKTIKIKLLAILCSIITIILLGSFFILNSIITADADEMPPHGWKACWNVHGIPSDWARNVYDGYWNPNVGTFSGAKGNGWLGIGGGCPHCNGGTFGCSGSFKLGNYNYSVSKCSCAEVEIGNECHDCYSFPFGEFAYNFRARSGGQGNTDNQCIGLNYNSSSSWWGAGYCSYMYGPWSGAYYGGGCGSTANHGFQSLYIWVSNPERDVPEDHDHEVLVYSDGGDAGIIDIRNDSPAGLEQLFKTDHYSERYERTTPQLLPTGQEALTDDITVHGVVWNIHQHIVHYTNMGIEWNTTYEYSYTVTKDFTQKINYTANPPVLTNQVWTPLNLNRGGYWGSKVTGDARYVTSADESEWGINYPSNTTNMGKVNGYATNSQGISDNSFIEGLDINSDIPLQLEFNNDSFGLDPEMEWENEPPKYAWDDLVMRGETAYAKGYNGHWGPHDDRYRFGTTIWGGVQDIGSNKLTSLYSYDPNEEFITGTQWALDLGKDYHSRKTFSHTFGVRAISSGVFKTANFNKENTNYPYAWVVTWNQGKFYEYGIHYQGDITIDGVTNPVAGTGPYGIVTGQIYNSSPWLLITTGEENCRGLYISTAYSTGETPVMVGKWRIKTLAGSATN